MHLLWVVLLATGTAGSSSSLAKPKLNRSTRVGLGKIAGKISPKLPEHMYVVGESLWPRPKLYSERLQGYKGGFRARPIGPPPISDIPSTLPVEPKSKEYDYWVHPVE
eukprot:92686-Amorphochlora_amoeboformis.AAC.1